MKAPPQKNSRPVEEHGTPQLVAFPFSESFFSEKVFCRGKRYHGHFVLRGWLGHRFQVFSRVLGHHAHS